MVSSLISIHELQESISFSMFILLRESIKSIKSYVELFWSTNKNPLYFISFMNFLRFSPVINNLYFLMRRVLVFECYHLSCSSPLVYLMFGSVLLCPPGVPQSFTLLRHGWFWWSLSSIPSLCERREPPVTECKGRTRPEGASQSHPKVGEHKDTNDRRPLVLPLPLLRRLHVSP